MDSETLSLFEDGLLRFNRERQAGARHADRWQDIAALGWFELSTSGCGRPEIVPLLSIYRAAGEGLWPEPLHCIFGESALLAAAAPDERLRSRLCAGLADGSGPLAYAAREPGDGWRPAPPAARARPGADGPLLTGRKLAVVEDARCAGYLVTAIDADGAAGCYLVEAGASGLAISRHPTVEGGSLADLDFDATPAQHVCPLPAAEQLHGWSALLAAAESVGIMRGASRDTLAYLRQRRQFGRPLIDFQVLQHRLAEMRMLERETDALLCALAQDFDRDGRIDMRATLALHAQRSRALRHVSREAVQLHGGMGITQECRVSHYYRRALTLDSLHGGEAAALERLAGA